MLKRFTLWALACLCCLGAAQAQITLILNDIGMIGDTVVLVSDTSTEILNPGPAGANQNWNFSTLTNGGLDTALFLAPNQTAFASEFPNATLAAQVGTVVAYNMLDTLGADTLLEQGFAGQLDVQGIAVSAVVPFVPNPISALFPANFGDHWSSDYAFSVTVGIASLGLPFSLPGVDSIRLKRVVQRRDTLDAWGELIIPNDTIAQTLRLKRHETIIDSVFTIGTTAGCGVTLELVPGFPIEVVPCATPSIEFTYQWWAEGRDLPVLNFTTDEADTVGGFTGVQYQYREPALSALPEASGVANVNLFPVPVAEQLSVHFTLLTAQRVELKVTDALGRVLMTETHDRQSAGAHRFILNTAALPTGAYFLSLSTKQGTVVRRFVK